MFVNTLFISLIWLYTLSLCPTLASGPTGTNKKDCLHKKETKRRGIGWRLTQGAQTIKRSRENIISDGESEKSPRM